MHDLQERIKLTDARVPLRMTFLYNRPGPGHKIYPYLLRDLAIDGPTRSGRPTSPTSRWRGASSTWWRSLDWYSRRVLAWRLSNTLTATSASRRWRRRSPALRPAGDLQHRPGQPFTGDRLHRRARWPRHRASAWTARALARQRLRRAAVARVKYEEVYLHAYDTASEDAALCPLLQLLQQPTPAFKP